MFDEEEVQEMLDECVEELESTPSSFTSFESDFIRSVEERNVEGFLSDAQIETLAKIHRERVCA